MSKKLNSKGFSGLLVLLIILVLAGAGFAGWYVWDKQRDPGPNEASKINGSIENTHNKSNQSKQDDTDKWTSVTTQDKAFTMKVPDGWTVTNYPENFLGSTDATYEPGSHAVIEKSDTEYAGHSLKFRASVLALNDSGRGPQWASPQPGLEESTEDFSIGDLHGKRFKANFSELHQTLYQYVFDLGDDRKLDIVYTVSRNKNQVDDVDTVEKAIKTIVVTKS